MSSPHLGLCLNNQPFLKIEEILASEKAAEQERDSRFVDLGRYPCEVRSGQYWRLDNLKSFDEFLERKFPESRRKAYYLMAIHEPGTAAEHADRVEPIQSYCKGLLLPGERKSVEPMAARLAPDGPMPAREQSGEVF